MIYHKHWLETIVSSAKPFMYDSTKLYKQYII